MRKLQCSPFCLKALGVTKDLPPLEAQVQCEYANYHTMDTPPC